MPIGPTRTKAQKQKVVHDEMRAFKNGELHSGSKSGPKVTNRKQAIAISLSESGQSKPHATQPRHPRNPGDYDSSAHGSVDHAKPAEKFRPGADAVAEKEAATARDLRLRGVGMQPVVPMRHEAPLNAHGYGHTGSQRSGVLRLSGAKGAHRIGAK